MADIPEDVREALLERAGLAQSDVDRLLERAQLVALPAGSTLHGAQRESYYVVARGIVSAYSHEKGSVRLSGNWGPGDLLCESGRPAGEPPRILFRADTEAVVLELDHELVEEFYRSNRSFRERLDRFYRETRTRSASHEHPSGPDDVHLGVATPHGVCGGQRFVAHFMAYTAPHRETVLRIIEAEAPRAEARPSLDTCAWRSGARVDVKLSSPGVEVSSATRSFRWNGSWQVERFDARLRSSGSEQSMILRFDVALEGLPLVRLRPEVQVRRAARGDETTARIDERPAPRSAFASYASADRAEVLGRVRSLEVVTRIDVFVDCLSIKPGERWKQTLRDEIRDREVFWLFWSRKAMGSPWVDWEWRTALEEKSIDGIQPHPLEPAELAPPPDELAELQFGSAHEWYVTQLRPRRFAAPLRRLWRRLLESLRSTGG